MAVLTSRWVPRALALALLAALVGATGCSVEAGTDVTSGTAESESFKKVVDYYDLDLPADVRDLEWAETKDWDSNQLYLHMRVDADGAETVLASYSIHLGDTEPYRDGLCRAALLARWHPPSGTRVRCGWGRGFGLQSAEVLVADTDGGGRELFLHVAV